MPVQPRRSTRKKSFARTHVKINTRCNLHLYVPNRETKATDRSFRCNAFMATFASRTRDQLDGAAAGIRGSAVSRSAPAGHSAGGPRGGGWKVKQGGGTSCPGSAHYEMEPEISALPGPFFSGVISRVLICSSIRIHTSHEWSTRAQAGRERQRRGSFLSNHHFIRKHKRPGLSILSTAHLGFELFNKNSGLCIQL